VLNALQQSFLSVQQAFSARNLVLNTSKTNIIWFGKKNAPLPTSVITNWGLRAWGSHLIQVLQSMARRYTVLLSASRCPLPFGHQICHQCPYRTHHCTL
jgi:hypothetical protein